MLRNKIEFLLITIVIFISAGVWAKDCDVMWQNRQNSIAYGTKEQQIAIIRNFLKKCPCHVSALEKLNRKTVTFDKADDSVLRSVLIIIKSCIKYQEIRPSEELFADMGDIHIKLKQYMDAIKAYDRAWGSGQIGFDHLNKNYTNIINYYKTEFMFQEGIDFSNTLYNKYKLNKLIPNAIRKLQDYDKSFGQYQSKEDEAQKYFVKGEFSKALPLFKTAKIHVLKLKNLNKHKVEEYISSLESNIKTCKYEINVSEARNFYQSAVNGKVEDWPKCYSAYIASSKIQNPNKYDSEKKNLAKEKTDFYKKYSNVEIGMEDEGYLDSLAYLVPKQEKIWERERSLIELRFAHFYHLEWIKLLGNPRAKSKILRYHKARKSLEDGNGNKITNKYTYQDDYFNVLKERIKARYNWVKPFAEEEKGDCFLEKAMNVEKDISLRIRMYQTAKTLCWDTNRVVYKRLRTKIRKLKELEAALGQLKNQEAILPNIEDFGAMVTNLTRKIQDFENLRNPELETWWTSPRELITNNITSIKKSIGLRALNEGIEAESQNDLAKAKERYAFAVTYGNVEAETYTKDLNKRLSDEIELARKYFAKRRFLYAYKQFKTVYPQIKDLKDVSKLNYQEDLLRRIPQELRHEILLSVELWKLINSQKAFILDDVKRLKAEIEDGIGLWGKLSKRDLDLLREEVEDVEADFYWLKAIMYEGERSYDYALKYFIIAISKTYCTVCRQSSIDRLKEKRQCIIESLKDTVKYPHDDIWKMLEQQKKEFIWLWFNETKNLISKNIEKEPIIEHPPAAMPAEGADRPESFKETPPQEHLEKKNANRLSSSVAQPELMEPEKSYPKKKIVQPRDIAGGREFILSTANYYYHRALFVMALRWYDKANAKGVLDIKMEDRYRLLKKLTKELKKLKVFQGRREGGSFYKKLVNLKQVLNVIKGRNYPHGLFEKEAFEDYCWGFAREMEGKYCQALYDNNYLRYFEEYCQTLGQMDLTFFYDFLFEKCLKIGDSKDISTVIGCKAVSGECGNSNFGLKECKENVKKSERNYIRKLSGALVVLKDQVTNPVPDDKIIRQQLDGVILQIFRDYQFRKGEVYYPLEGLIIELKDISNIVVIEEVKEKIMGVINQLKSGLGP